MKSSHEHFPAASAIQCCVQEGVYAQYYASNPFHQTFFLLDYLGNNSWVQPMLSYMLALFTFFPFSLVSARVFQIKLAIWIKLPTIKKCNWYVKQLSQGESWLHINFSETHISTTLRNFVTNAKWREKCLACQHGKHSWLYLVFLVLYLNSKMEWRFSLWRSHHMYSLMMVRGYMLFASKSILYMNTVTESDACCPVSRWSCEPWSWT